VNRLFRLVAAAALFLLALAACYATWYVATPLTVDRLPVEFEIPRGASLRAAVRGIEAAGVRVGVRRFELLARLARRAEQVKAGNYELTGAPTPLELLDRIVRGDVVLAQARIGEGWTFRQLRAALDAHRELRHDTRGLSEAQILERIGADETRPEGLFLPETYFFSRGASDLDLLRRAHRALRRHLAREWEARAPALPYRSPYEALVMASIVEKETGRAEERARIAGVLVNRLRAGMLLQADPTVIYGLGEAFDGNLRKEHLLRDGPYNTYTRPGLPPTPIAMPSLASIRAALQPEATDAYYYVARGDGTSEFSRTLEEHNRAVRKYQTHVR